MNKWKMNRAGLLNFWYYDEEIFQFADGKLLLRGSNGSGKSVTMQSFLPVLLYGKTSPDRLDPFGSKARRMEDYLLGEKEISGRDERTGYLFIEFKRAETDQYLTIGMGLQAKRNKKMKFWGFLITDNRRIAKDFHLYRLERHAGEEQKLPLSRVELENAIDNGGHVVQTKSEYMQLVNRYLFNFETLDAYEDLIKLLIQLRSPKLSKDFKPTVIYEILEAALPPLSDEDLRHLSDTIEQMDQTKQQIEQLDRESEAITSLHAVYQTYNEYILAEQAQEFSQAIQRLEKELELEQKNRKEQNLLQEAIDELENEIKSLSIQQETYQEQEERLRSHKIWDLEKERSETKTKLREERSVLERKADQLADRKQKDSRLRNDLAALEVRLAKLEEEQKNQLLDLENDAEEAAFTEAHAINAQDFSRHQQRDFDFTLWKKEAANHLEHLEKLIEQLRNMESLKEKYQEKDRQQADMHQELDKALREQEDWTRLFEEDKEKKLDEIHTWVQRAAWLDIPEETLQETARSLHSLYENTAYEQVKEPYRQAVFDYEQEKRKTLSQLAFDRDKTEEILAEKQEELKEWKNKKDPEPEMDPLTKEARDQLAEKSIACTPLYAAIEFQDDVPEDVQRRIEAALMDSGMLNALITEDNLEVTHDKILTRQPQMMAYTLANFLKPDVEADSKVRASTVDEVLRSILIEEDGASRFSVDEKGNYQLGLLKGHALPVENVRYIGRNARKRYREEKIVRLEEEISALLSDKSEFDEAIRQTKASIQEAKQKLEEFPGDADLAASFQEIRQKKLEVSHLEQQIESLSHALQRLYRDFTQMKRQLDEATRSYDLAVSLSSFQEAALIMKRYEKDLSELEKTHIQYVNTIEQQHDRQMRLEELEGTILELQGEINIAEDEVRRLEEQIKQIEKQLEQHGETDIRKQIADVQGKLFEIKEELDQKKQLKPRKESDLTHLEQALENTKRSVHFWKQMTAAWEQSFVTEWQRGFVGGENDHSPEEAANDLLNRFGQVLKERDRSKLSEHLTKAFFEQQTDLMEYRLNSFNAPVQIPSWMEEETANEEQAIHISNWKQKSGRTLIELNYLGKKFSPAMLKAQIELEQERQESFLDEQDRALYEEILFHSVGQKLRVRISRAETWVNKMKKLMETRDTSSGLSFSIQWKPRTADSETELDTVDLVRLLRQDAKLLKEEDKDKMIEHFRTKIAKAKELAENESEMQTFLQVLKEVLDYRKWFSFVLYFKREGENKRELTNNQFYKFSGGEKAMAMYIPLFTACYSRYLEADPEAPYIISLDEAFAGVDENNIREMFEIVEQLEFDYIMNSQVLWGDYDTVKELSIYELVRPKNADFVSTIRYHWDGSKRTYEEPEEIEEEFDMKVRQ